MSKMTDTIKKVQAAAEAVLERAINPEEVIQAIEAIEVLVGAAQATQQHTITTMAETVPAAPAATESSAKPKRRYKKRKSSVRIVNWDKHINWNDKNRSVRIHAIK